LEVSGWSKHSQKQTNEGLGPAHLKHLEKWDKKRPFRKKFGKKLEKPKEYIRAAETGSVFLSDMFNY
jgi:hypothetical protein